LHPWLSKKIWGHEKEQRNPKVLEKVPRRGEGWENNKGAVENILSETLARERTKKRGRGKTLFALMTTIHLQAGRENQSYSSV